MSFVALEKVRHIHHYLKNLGGDRFLELKFHVFGKSPLNFADPELKHFTKVICTRDVHKTLFAPNQSEYLIIFCFWGHKTPTKNFIIQLHPETMAPATPMFLPVPYTGKISKIAF